jgi:O-antigen/teichoic acid export membrane protein
MTIHQPSYESLAARTVKGSAYSIAASGITLGLGLGRSILMARLLTPEDFGLVAFAMTLLNFTAPLRNFGLDLALIHRKIGEDALLDDALAVHFSLRLILAGIFVLLLLVAAPLLRSFYPQNMLLVPVLLVLAIGEIAVAAGATPITFLRKEMRFKDLAVIQVFTSLTMTIVGPAMALYGWGVWAIVGETISGVIVGTVAVWVLFRPWRPHWKLERGLVKWYWEYGKFMFVSQLLLPVVQQFDEFWIGTTLGNTSLGWYSKAYEFAQYPHRIISVPIINVALSSFAQAQDDRLTLSKSYYRIASFIIRTGFLVTGVLILIAYEFVTLLLGAKWAPMILTFQLMAVYILLLPFFTLTANLMTAVGRPQVNMRVLMVQSAFFVPAVILAARWHQINGVAIATDLVMIIGIIYLLRHAKKLVDFSLKEMVLPPLVAFVLGVGLAWLLSSFVSQDIAQLFVKALSCFFIYNLVLLLLEGKKWVILIQMVRDMLLKRSPAFVKES